MDTGTSYYGIWNGSLFRSDSDNNGGGDNASVRPVVSIGNGYQITKCEGEADGSSESNMHQLSKLS